MTITIMIPIINLNQFFSVESNLVDRYPKKKRNKSLKIYIKSLNFIKIFHYKFFKKG